jgi:hypothetical protein
MRLGTYHTAPNELNRVSSINSYDKGGVSFDCRYSSVLFFFSLMPYRSPHSRALCSCINIAIYFMLLTEKIDRIKDKLIIGFRLMRDDQP